MFRGILFLLIIAFSFSLFAKTVYIVPVRGYDAKKLFYDSNSYPAFDATPFCRLREAIEKMGYKVKFTKDCKGLKDCSAIISFEGYPELIKNISKYPKEKCFLICFDPHIHTPWAYDQHTTQYFKKIFVMFDDLIDNQNYFKFHYPQRLGEKINNIPKFSDKKLCTMIVSKKSAPDPKSLYEERYNVVDFFRKLYRNGIDDFDLYGRGWKGTTRLWKGEISGKTWDVFKNYKFAICYENTKNQKGYITEKIFDCMLGGCVPVYLGADNITDYIPKECFIDRRDFDSIEKVYDFIKKMDQATYEGYIQAIATFLQSPGAERFSIENFVNLVKEELAYLDSKNTNLK
jgi:hypothetical protein